MKVSTGFTFSKVLFNKATENHLVVTLEAPPVNKSEKRLPICIIPVLDVSGSMSGDKLDYAKKTTLKMIDHLQPGDFFGVVTFGNDANVVAAPAEVTQTRKDELKVAVGRIGINGGTNFAAGMMEGMAVGNKLDIHQDMIVRVIMLTDGQPTHGIATTLPQLVALAKANRGRVSISAFGYGEDCSHELLTGLAKEAEGNYAFVKNPEDAVTAFAKELGGLTSVHATDIQVTLKAAGENKINEVLSDVDTDDIDSGVVIKVPEILAEEKRHLVIEMETAEQKKAFPRATSVVDVEVSYSVVEDGKLVKKSESTKAKLEFVKEGEQSDKPDKTLDKIVGMAQMVKAQVEAEALAAKGNYQGAAAAIQTLGVAFNTRGLGDLAAFSNTVSANYGSAASYATSSGIRATSSRLMSRAYGASSSDEATSAEVGDILRSVGLSVANTSQSETVSSFGDDVSSSQVPVGNDLASIAGTINVKTKAGPAGRSASAKKSKSRW